MARPSSCVYAILTCKHLTFLTSNTKTSERDFRDPTAPMPDGYFNEQIPTSLSGNLDPPEVDFVHKLGFIIEINRVIEDV